MAVASFPTRINGKDIQMRFGVEQVFQSTVGIPMRAEVIEVSNEGRDAKMKLLTDGGGTFELNAGAVMIGHQKWHLVS